MKKWIETLHCKSRAHCRHCLQNAGFRQMIMTNYIFDGRCPLLTEPQTENDVLESVPTPPAVERARRANQPCGNCRQKSEALRRLHLRMQICQRCGAYDSQYRYCIRANLPVVEMAGDGDICPNGSWTPVDEVQS